MSTRLVAAAAFVASFGLASGGAIGAEPGSEPAAPAVSIQMDVGHFGVTAFGTPLTYPLSEAWRLQFDGPVSYPLIANGRVFVTVGNANEYGTTLFALDAKTGQSLWSQSITGTYFWSAAAYDSGQVFVLSFDGLLKAFDEKTGVMNWSVQVANEYFVTSPPVAGNGVVYVEGDGSDTLTAYLETSGALIWTQGIEAGDGAPALSSEGIYTYSPCQVYAFHPISGRPLWHYAGDCDGGGGTTPVYRNNSLYISDPAGSGNQIFNAATGAITGTFDTNALPPTISRGVAYYLASGTLEAVDLSSNKVPESRFGRLMSVRPLRLMAAAQDPTQAWPQAAESSSCRLRTSWSPIIDCMAPRIIPAPGLSGLQYLARGSDCRIQNIRCTLRRQFHQQLSSPL